MKTQRILVCDAELPYECVDSLMAAIEDGKDNLCSKNGADMDMCFLRGVGDARAVITAFQPDVILLMLGGSVFARTGAIVGFAESLAARPSVVGLIAEGGQEEARAVLRAGADDFILTPLRTSEILTRVRCVLDRKARRRYATTDAEFSNASGIIGKSPAFRREIERLPRIAGCDASVLISGETGTGKELFARAIHDLSSRASRPFVPLNCEAIPAELAESELFGHERGAFTGAHARSRGMIREADGGTLFLDEVTSLPASLQVKLLRFLQEKEVRPLGNGSLHHVNAPEGPKRFPFQ